MTTFQWNATLKVSIVLAVYLFAVPSAVAATGLPFTSSFEGGDYSEWDGGLDASMIVTSAEATDGTFSVRATKALGQTADNYKDYIFGDHVRVGGLPVTPQTGIWLRLDSKFDAGFVFGSAAIMHKIAIINFEDENGRRRYQVIINVQSSTREYFVEHLKWNADRSFNRAFPGIRQNVGTPVQPRLGQWDRLLLFVKPNTPGNLDGEVRFWVNGDLKAEYRNMTLREDTQYNPNKLIMSNHVSDTTTQDVQKWDYFYLGETAPADVVRPMPPQNFRVE